LTVPTIITVTLPLPSKATHPNARPHHMAKANAKAKDRKRACYYALEAMKAQRFGWTSATVQCTFTVRRRNDADNLQAWMKAYFDGFVDAGLLANDDRLTHLPVVQVTGKQTGVSVTLSKTGGGQ
jgi:Holliday junction resolvase RusA-like endonuclease